VTQVFSGQRLPAIFLACLCSLQVFCALAQEAPSVAADPVLEKRVMQLSEELRCLVCQNQSLSDSNAELATDLRNQVREMMQAGKSDAQIRDYMVASYGDFILYDPPFKMTTLVLWVGPFVLLVLGGALLARNLKQRRQAVSEQALTSEQRARARALLSGNQDEAQ
jgi:cytochrome c-type biogenesis protein CcmH